MIKENIINTIIRMPASRIDKFSEGRTKGVLGLDFINSRSVL